MNEHLVFVYGTLRQGDRLNWLLESADYLGQDVTEEYLFDMYSYTDQFPAVIAGTYRIAGEVYRVDQKTLKYLDWVERVPLFYQRNTVKLVQHDFAFMYVANEQYCAEIKNAAPADREWMATHPRLHADKETLVKSWVIP